ALRDAFREIKKKGSEKRYAQGYLNFELFMQEVYNRYQVTATDHVRELIALLGTGMFEGPLQEKESLLNIINSHPEWEAEYEAFCRMEVHEDLMQDFPVIAVLSEKGLVRERTFTNVLGCESVDGILPGRYKIKLANTGWIIWEGYLSAEELISSEAPKGENLRAAAGSAIPTRKIKPLDYGCLILRIYAGIENGCIEIELTGREDFKNG
ncbi:hypothetical protein ACFL3Q_15445, partial [Planctomycetota bacterium]